MRRLGPRPLTNVERQARYRQSQAAEIQQLRRALLAALARWPPGDQAGVALYLAYADVIARAHQAEKENKL